MGFGIDNSLLDDMMPAYRPMNPIDKIIQRVVAPKPTADIISNPSFRGPFAEGVKPSFDASFQNPFGKGNPSMISEMKPSFDAGFQGFGMFEDNKNLTNWSS